MKLKFLVFALFLFFHAHGKTSDEVTIVTTGSGKTLDDAIRVALRGALEQTFGTFISSKTELLNDALTQDLITTVSTGNILSYVIISQVKLEGEHSVSLKTTVSTSKFASFVESKGSIIEFKGGLFAFNILQQALNEKSEIVALVELRKVISKFSDESFDYKLKVFEPYSKDGTNRFWTIPMYVSVYPNDNINNLKSHIYKTLSGLSLTKDEAYSYINLKKPVYPISLAINEKEFGFIILRTHVGFSQVVTQLYNFNHSLQNFKISNGLPQTVDRPQKLTNIYDKSFRVFLKNSRSNQICKSSVFYWQCDLGCNLGEVLDQHYSGGEGRGCSPDPILNVDEWFAPKLQGYAAETAPERLRMKSMEISDFIININQAYSPPNENFLSDHILVDQFSFIKKLKKDIGAFPTAVISFVNIKTDSEICRFYFEDLVDLSELKAINQYSVSPVVN
jgi:hypothetical protein